MYLVPVKQFIITLYLPCMGSLFIFRILLDNTPFPWTSSSPFPIFLGYKL